MNEKLRKSKIIPHIYVLLTHIFVNGCNFSGSKVVNKVLTKNEVAGIE